jgi:hypothetical protein
MHTIWFGNLMRPLAISGPQMDDVIKTDLKEMGVGVWLV